MTALAIGGVVLLTLLLLGLLMRTRRRSPGVNDVAASNSDPTALDAKGSVGEVVLMPLPNQRGEALALGSPHALAALEDSGLATRAGGEARGPLPQLIRETIAFGGSEATRRTNKGIDSGRIVALADETVKHMSSNKPTLDQAGKTLGVVRGKKGFVHVARFDKAGAKALTASNAATLAMTAALSQQLASIEKQLEEIQETLDELLGDMDRERLADAVSTNMELARIVRDIQRHGKMTKEDMRKVDRLSHAITKNATQADFKVGELMADQSMNRKERVRALDKLMKAQRLEYWLAFQIQAELAFNRRELLRLYWEQIKHPETAQHLADEVRREIHTRQERMAELGRALDELADPEARTFWDHTRLRKARRLKKHDETVTALLGKHGQAFAGAEADPYRTLSSAVGEPVVIEAGARKGSESSG